ncbi:hypothetical protein COO91_02518 [Nostoc flagelliforme CCNUN1]|uniref:Uncharacterized protein n=1 Tax=Nostoc flagelliforme CCNUN1 TaxID=2038116 RepID=A0A2K8SMD7_9NOSO|nr:hypothetical protein COO91_02518 [Nostoc flagelliforme CCNUN1]
MKKLHWNNFVISIPAKGFQIKKYPIAMEVGEAESITNAPCSMTNDSFVNL